MPEEGSTEGRWGQHETRGPADVTRDRKSTRLNSSHLGTSYAVFCLKKKNDDRPIGENLTGVKPNSSASRAGAAGGEETSTDPHRASRSSPYSNMRRGSMALPNIAA